MHRGRRLLLDVGIFVIVAAVIAGSYLFNLARTFDTNSTKIEQAFPAESTRPEKPPPAQGAGKTPMNILLLGSDSRGATEADAEKGVATDPRADTLMLLHILAERKNIYTMSVMRDLWVDIPGHGKAKISAALALGGTPLMVQTIESIFKQRIDHVAMVDFQGFKGLTDALGGVTVDIKVPFNSSHLKGHYFQAGPNTLNGDEALALVRERYAYADGDYQRVRNQQDYLKSVIKKTIDGQTLSNPVTINNLVGALSPYVSVDESLDAASLAGLALELRDVRAPNTVMFTLPTAGTGTSADGQSIVLPLPAAITHISDALAADSLGTYVGENHFQNGN
ncbi:LCP family protein [Arthrobacter sp. UYEF3]|uniref:LCP family protein n=1 Tax=Arthrobacter sp. UYEF3 TaxID=1756365 RepID=UPI0033932E7D